MGLILWWLFWPDDPSVELPELTPAEALAVIQEGPRVLGNEAEITRCQIALDDIVFKCPALTDSEVADKIAAGHRLLVETAAEAGGDVNHHVLDLAEAMLVFDCDKP